MSYREHHLAPLPGAERADLRRLASAPASPCPRVAVSPRRPLPSTRLHRAAALAMLVVLLGNVLAACAAPSRRPAQQQEAPQGAPVNVARVARETLTAAVTYGGTVAPLRQVTILPRVAGRIVRLPVEVGSVVKAGDPVAELDHATIDAQIAQARANVAAAQANVAAADARLANILDGAKPEDIAVQEAAVEAARIRVAQVQAGARAEDLAASEAQLRAAETRLAQAQAGGRAEDVVAAQAVLETARNRLAQVQAAGRAEDLRAAETQLASARARLAALLNPRPEDVAAQQAALDQARTRLANLIDAPKARTEDLHAAELAVETARLALERALADLDGQKARAPGAGTTAGQIQAAVRAQEAVVAQAQVALAVSQNNLDKLRNTTTSEWDLRLQQLAVQQAEASLTRQLNPSPSDLATAQAAVVQAETSLEKLRTPTSFDVAAAQESVNQAQANLEKVRNPDPFNVQIQQAAYDQALASLDKLRTVSGFDLQAAEAALRQAEAQMEARKNPFTANDRRAAEASVAQARAALEQSRAALTIQQANLNEAFVVAPFDGTISDRPVTEGAVVTVNTPLATLISREVEVALNVEETNIARFQESQSAALRVNAYPNETFRGIVSSIFPTAEARSRTFTVKVRPEDPAGKLRPGMFAQLTVTLERREGALVVPKEAVLYRDDRPHAFVAADDVAQLRQLSLGLTDERRMEVLSGLNDGEQVIVAGHATLRDKDPVRTVQPGQRGQPGGQPGQTGQPQRPQGQQGQPGGQPGQGAQPQRPAGQEGQQQRPQGQPGQQGQPGGQPGQPPQRTPSGG